MPLFLLFILLPLMELWVFVKVCGEIGFLLALILLVISGMVGGAIIRQQGFRTIIAMHDAMSRGKMPLDQLFDGFCIVAAGLLFIFPGFITDVLAILLLLPHLRGILRSYIQKHPGWTASGTSTVIEGEFERVEDNPVAITQRTPPGE